MDNGFSATRNHAFPAGLRVLVVDYDSTWLKILEKMLKKCSYEVTTCGLARDALKLIREQKDGWDIVISDVDMPDMDGFKFLQHIGLEMDLPVIMMSIDGATGRVMKGVQQGACDYLLKPIRMKELRNIWQHAFRKVIHEMRDIKILEGKENIQISRIECKSNCDDNDYSSRKKARVVWSVELHQEFIKAVSQIGLDKVGPSKILHLMNVPWLTRENVVHHLQKYRLYLSRLQKYNDLITSVARIEHSDMALMESVGSFASNLISFSGSCSSTRSITSTECSCNMDFTDASNATQFSTPIVGNRYAYERVLSKFVSNGSHERSVQLRRHESDGEEEVVSKLVIVPENASSMDVSDPSSARSAESGSSHSTSSESPAGSGANSAAFGSTFLFRTSHNDQEKHESKEK